MAKKNKLQEEELAAHKERVRLINEASKSLNDYNKLLHETESLNKNLLYIQGQRAKLQEEAKKLQDEITKREANGLALTDKEIDARKVKIGLINNEVNSLTNVEIQAEKNLKIHQDAVKSVKVHALTAKDIVRQTKELGKILYDQRHYWLKQQKSVRETELQMGILSNQAAGFRDNIYKSSITTAKIGINTKDLAQLQGRYSDNIGRSVQLSGEQLEAMSQLAKGTVLGVEGAGEFAAEMENFNISAKGSVAFVEDMLATSTKMGVSSGKVIKNVQNNMKIANKYAFKGGIKGLGEMANLATKFKIEMQTIADFAENLITPEGAVEAAAKLQVLGGAWARLGDPFELMYRSRNDMKGLTQDIINATKETARFDEATGEVTIDPMELHRLREVANATGMSFDELAKSAREAAKFTKIESGISSIFSDEDKSFISSLAQFDKDSGEFKVTMQVGNETVTESVDALQRITPEIVKSQQEYQKSLQGRAEEAMTFNERFDALKDTFKSGLLPAFEKISGVIESLIATFSPMVTNIAEFMAEWPKTFAAIGGVVTGLALIGKEALWFARGIKLGLGFNSVANADGGINSLLDDAKGVTSKQWGGKLFGNMAKGGGFKGLLRNVGKGSVSGGAIGAGLLAGGLAGYNEWSENKEAGMDTGENIHRTAMTGLGGGLGAWGGAAAGAAIGSIIPVIGTTIGGIVGGIVGGWGGTKLGDLAGDARYGGEGMNYSMPQNDFIARPNQDAIPFNSSDTLIGAKPDGPIDRILDKNGIAKPGKNDDSIDSSSLIKAIEKGKNIERYISKEKAYNHSGSKVLVEFNKPLAVEGKLELTTNDGSFKIDLNDPFLMRELSRKIQEQLTSAINGGRIPSNPIVA